MRVAKLGALSKTASEDSLSSEAVKAVDLEVTDSRMLALWIPLSSGMRAAFAEVLPTISAFRGQTMSKEPKMNILRTRLRVACRNPSVLDEVAALIARPPASAVIGLTWGHRRVPLSRGRHHGGYVCAFRGQPLLRVESALERRVVKALASTPACVALVTQPVTVNWTWKGAVRRYTPDILVMFDEVPDEWRQLGLARLSLIEVKPARFTMNEELYAEHTRSIRAALGMPLVRLPVAQEVSA